MPISSVGKRSKAGSRPPRAEQGVTLLELLVVTAIVGLIVGLSFPSISAGLECIRLSSATNSIVSFLNGALNRAERREEAIEVVIWPKENRLAMYSSAPGFERHLQLPEGVTI